MKGQFCEILINFANEIVQPYSSQNRIRVRLKGHITELQYLARFSQPIAVASQKGHHAGKGLKCITLLTSARKPCPFLIADSERFSDPLRIWVRKSSTPARNRVQRTTTTMIITKRNEGREVLVVIKKLAKSKCQYRGRNACQQA